MSAPSGQRPVGSATEEAARLVESLGGWFAAASGSPVPGPADPTAAHTGGGGFSQSHTGHSHTGRSHTGQADTVEADAGQADTGEAERPTSDGSRDRPAHDPSTCRHCPLCRGMQALRAVRPEVVGHLSAAADSLAAALRELGAPSGAAAPSPQPPPRAGSPPGAEHVPIRVPDDDAPSRATDEKTST